MSAASMINAVNAAVKHHGYGDEVIAAGQFIPRGSTGAMFAGGLIGDEVGGAFGAGGTVGDAVATVGGAIAGAHTVAGARGLPPAMLVGVSAQWIYGFAGRSRSREPQQLVFRLPRAGLEVSVHQRVNVRILVLAMPDGSARIELEGNRLPITHSRDVIDILVAADAGR